MEPTNTSLNGKGTAVLDKEAVTDLDNHKYVTPSGAATMVRVEPQIAPQATPDAAKEKPTSLPPEEGKSKSKSNKGRKALVLAGLGVGAVAAGVVGFHWWQYASAHETTDDAYVVGNPHSTLR